MCLFIDLQAFDRINHPLLLKGFAEVGYRAKGFKHEKYFTDRNEFIEIYMTYSVNKAK